VVKVAATTLDTLTDQPNLDKESCFYRLPLSFGALKLNQIEIDAKQLSNEVANISGGNSLWDNFKTHFNSVYQSWAGRLAYPMLLYLEPH
jgi:hypothetical protein